MQFALEMTDCSPLLWVRCNSWWIQVTEVRDGKDRDCRLLQRSVDDRGQANDWKVQETLATESV